MKTLLLLIVVVLLAGCGDPIYSGHGTKTMTDYVPNFNNVSSSKTCVFPVISSAY